MKKLIVSLIVLLVLALAMAVTCPDKQSLARHIDRSKGGDGNLLDKAKAKALTAQARLTTDYRDRVLFATAKVGQGRHKEHYLGIFNTWVKLSNDK
jgi:hypothetical protein